MTPLEKQIKIMKDKYWFPDGVLTNGIGIITDVFMLGYVEIQDIETKKYYIVHESKLQPAK